MFKKLKSNIAEGTRELDETIHIRPFLVLGGLGSIAVAMTNVSLLGGAIIVILWAFVLAWLTQRKK